MFKEEEETILFFFLISFKFPIGKLGFGPENPFALSLLYAKLGKTHQEYEIPHINNKRKTAIAKQKVWKN